MPIQRCMDDGKPGYKWGPSGHCYPYTAGDEASRKRAYELAHRQEIAARANGYAGKETCMECGGSILVGTFISDLKKCCIDTFVPWQLLGEGQKLKCINCGNMLGTERVEKGSFLGDDWRAQCALLLRKAVFPTRDDVDRWLSHNPYGRRYDFKNGKLQEVDTVVETETAFAVVVRPYDWFVRGTLKAQWTSMGIIIVTGNLREDADGRLPTEAELRSTAAFAERI